MKKSEIQTTWDLSTLYKSIDDPQMEKDMRSLERAYAKFAKKYTKNTKYLTNASVLKDALEEYYALYMHAGYKVLRYLHLSLDENTSDSRIAGKLVLIMDRYKKVIDSIRFFKLELSSVTKKQQKIFLTSAELKDFKKLLQDVFEQAKYLLDSKEERVVSRFQKTSYDMWQKGAAQIVSAATVSFDGKERSFGEMREFLTSPSKSIRHKAVKVVNEKFEEIGPYLEHFLNGAVHHRSILDGLRGYKKPESSTLISYENSEKEVNTLLDVVVQAYPLVHSFYKAQALLMYGKGKKLLYVDRNAPGKKIKKKFSFYESLETFKSALADLPEKYAEILETYALNNQFDVYPRQHKRGGAYCWKSNVSPTVVLLSHVDDINSYTTLAHEMGHAFHGELTDAHQPLWYNDFTISTAETASTFFERLALDYVFEDLSDADKLSVLQSKIQGSIATIFRRIAFYGFEKDLHDHIRKEGKASHIVMRDLMLKHLKAYLGPAFDLKDNDGYQWVIISHFFRYFYVYSYSYGELLSSLMYKRYKEGTLPFEKIENFLSSGSAQKPHALFKKLGIDTFSKDTYKEALGLLEEDIRLFKKLVKKNSK